MVMKFWESDVYYVNHGASLCVCVERVCMFCIVFLQIMDGTAIKLKDV